MPPAHRLLRAVAVGVILGSAFVAAIALAKLARNTIDPVALVTDDGLHVIATGPVLCIPAGERYHVHVTVSQRTTGAVAVGRSLATCTGSAQQWEVHASVQGNAAFEPGPAIAVALGRTTDRGLSTDAHQWLVPITLVEE